GVGSGGGGSMGESLVVLGSWMLGGAFGFKWGFWTFGILLLVWLVVFWSSARNAPSSGPPKSLGDMLHPLQEGMSWVLSLYYFLTFGGFVAMAVYLPTFLTELFGLTPQDAGLRTAGLVLLATSTRAM